MSRGKKIALLSLILLLVLTALCCFLFAIISLLGTFNSAFEQALEKGATDQTVAVIDVNGVITTVSAADIFGNSEEDLVTSTVRKLERAKNDDNVKAVLLRIDSPGGEVYGTKLIYNKIKEVQAEGKVVVVLMKGTAASGGYYISAPADWIVASEMTLTGSIGVIFTTYDLSGLYEKIGVEEQHIANSEGNLKVLDNLGDPNSEGYKLLQSVADDYYDNFVNVIEEGRSMTRAEVVALADGRVYSGQQAYDNGLIDQLGEQPEALVKVAELAELDDPNFVVYQDDRSGMNYYGMAILTVFKPEIFALNNAKSGITAQYLMAF